MKSGITKKYLDELIYKVLGAAIEVHKILGPGLLESVYHKCMKHELYLRNIKFTSHEIVPVLYKGITMETELRSDLYVEECLIVELKSIEALAPINEAQTLTYMRLSEAPKGVLINFNCLNIFKEGQKTLVNELLRKLAEG
jgi:GxxExxY protein